MAKSDTKYIFFWKATENYGELSQWYRSSFTHNGMTFETAEQYMMYEKAMTFGDEVVANRILSTPWAHPNEHRKLGRTVRNFDVDTWNRESMHVVVTCNILKFAQNEDLKNVLMGTQGKMLVETSPFDRTWGIGFSEANAVHNVNFWGQNKLGEALMWVRVALGWGT